MSKENKRDDFITPHVESILLQLRNEFLTPEVIENLEKYRREVEDTFDKLKSEGVISEGTKTLPMEYRSELLEKYGLRGIFQPKADYKKD